MLTTWLLLYIIASSITLVKINFK